MLEFDSTITNLILNEKPFNNNNNEESDLIHNIDENNVALILIHNIEPKLLKNHLYERILAQNLKEDTLILLFEETIIESE